MSTGKARKWNGRSFSGSWMSIDETCFYFSDDPIEEEHYLGYLPEYEKPYWAGYCDVEGGCEFKTASELVNAPIYDGKSLKSRWDKVVIVSIESFPVDDWMQCFHHV